MPENLSCPELSLNNLPEGGISYHFKIRVDAGEIHYHFSPNLLHWWNTIRRDTLRKELISSRGKSSCSSPQAVTVSTIKLEADRKSTSFSSDKDDSSDSVYWQTADISVGAETGRILAVSPETIPHITAKPQFN